MQLPKLLPLLFCVPAFAAQFKLQSKNFKDDGAIPLRFTCKGESISPQLSWSGAPKGTKSYVLIVDAPKGEESQTLWLLYNVPAEARAVGEGTKTFPPGSQQGLNEEKERHYTGPCPLADADGKVHFKLYALDNTTRFFTPPVRQDLEKAMAGHILAHTELVARVSESNPYQ